MNKLLSGIPIITAAIVLYFVSRPNPWSLIVGGCIVLAGESVRVWACGHLVRNQEVTTSGPYAHVRDPLYLGRLLLLVGFSVMAWGYSWIIFLIGLAVFFFRYMPRKHRKEMARLEKIFGEQYTAYANSVHSLLPRFTRYPQSSGKRWSFDTFWNENREQLLLSAVVLLAAALVARYLLI